MNPSSSLNIQLSEDASVPLSTIDRYASALDEEESLVSVPAKKPSVVKFADEPVAVNLASDLFTQTQVDEIVAAVQKQGQDDAVILQVSIAYALVWLVPHFRLALDGN